MWDLEIPKNQYCSFFNTYVERSTFTKTGIGLRQLGPKTPNLGIFYTACDLCMMKLCNIWTPFGSIWVTFWPGPGRLWPRGRHVVGGAPTIHRDRAHHPKLWGAFAWEGVDVNNRPPGSFCWGDSLRDKRHQTNIFKKTSMKKLNQKKHQETYYKHQTSMILFETNMGWSGGFGDVAVYSSADPKSLHGIIDRVLG